MPYCTECGSKVHPGVKFCPECGASVKSQVKESVPSCSECGAEVHAGIKFCPNCGAKNIIKPRRRPSAAPSARGPRPEAMPEETRLAPYGVEGPLEAPPGHETPVTGAKPGKAKKKSSAPAIVGLVIGGVIFILILSGGILPFEGSNPEPTHWIVAENGYYYAHYSWSYKGIPWTYDADIPVEYYELFANEPRSAHDYAKYVDNPSDDEWINDLANNLVNLAEDEGWGDFETVSFALAFVQSMPYTSDAVTTGYDEYPRYPIETIVDGGGDCEDTSILFSSIVREMGYGTVLLWLKDDGHMAAGVSVSQDLIDSWNQDYSITYYTKDGSIYAYCETTGDGFELGEMPDDMTGMATILVV